MRKLLTACILLLLFSVPVLSSDLDLKIKSQQVQLRKIAKQIAFHTRELNRTKQKEQVYLRDLANFDHQVQVSTVQIEKLNGQIKSHEASLRQLDKNIQTRSGKIKKIQSLMAERLVTIYKYGGQAELNVLLSAKDSTELQSTAYLLRWIADQDQKMIKSLQNEKMQIQADIIETGRQKRQLDSKRRGVAKVRDTNRQAVAQRQTLLQRVSKEKKVHEAAMAEFAEAAREVQNKINLFLKRKAEEERRRREQGKAAEPVYTHSGRFAWPIPQHKLSSSFGVRVHPKFRTKINHTGIDVPAPRGTPVRSAGDGEVIYAGWLRGYGQLVIIDHGSGYSTVYGHMSALLTQEGRKVKTGTVIGRVGSTGVSTGNHLHFEVRVNGTARNPLKYLGG